MPEFLPANESRLFIRLFRIYIRRLFRRRFAQVWLQQQYRPGPGDRTVYFLNHHSWWDGLIPLLLNEYRFRQRARALMEDRQMRQYSFFSRIGAFSVDRSDPRSSLRSLRYAVESMRRPNASLFIYPEGTLTPQGSSMRFEGGLSWLHGQLGSPAGPTKSGKRESTRETSPVDFVPVAIRIHTLRHNKPELHLSVGSPVELPPDMPAGEKTAAFEQVLQRLLDGLHTAAGFDDTPFERFL